MNQKEWGKLSSKSRLLRLLEKDPRIKVKDLSNALGLPVSSTADLLKKTLNEYKLEGVLTQIKTPFHIEVYMKKRVIARRRLMATSLENAQEEYDKRNPEHRTLYKRITEAQI